MARSRVELFAQIRRDRRVEGLSIRELADRPRVHRRTVRQALENAVRRTESYPPRRRPADRAVCRGHRRLVANRSRGAEEAAAHGPAGLPAAGRRAWRDLAEVTVSRHVARRKVEPGLDRIEVAVPQTHDRRHTATLLLSQGADVKAVARFLDHAHPW